MTLWLFFPSFQSARAAAGSTEESSELCAEQAKLLARSCTASGKHSPRRTWLTRWRKGGWIRRLSSLTAARSPEEFASDYGEWLDGILSESSAESPAPISAQPESAAEQPASIGSGLQSLTSSPIAEWDGVSWRTSQASQELKTLLSQSWPRSPEVEVCSATLFELDEYGSASQRLSEDDLRSAELLGIWPRSGGVSSGRLFERPRLAPPIVESESSLSGWITGGAPLCAQAGQWATPCAADTNGGRTHTKGGRSLCDDIEQWPTPSCRDHARESSGQLERNTPGLGATVAGSEWPTPTLGDYKASGSRNTEGSKAHAGVSLSDMVATGDSTSGRAEGAKGRLNWRFVAWLMGWRWLIGDTPRPWPPGPKDAEAWAEVLAVRPGLAPALPGADQDRAAMLRLLGNGVVPDQADAAVSGLIQRLRGNHEERKFTAA